MPACFSCPNQSQVTLAEWLTRCPAKALSFGRAGSNPAGDDLLFRFAMRSRDFLGLGELLYMFLRVNETSHRGIKSRQRLFMCDQECGEGI